MIEPEAFLECRCGACRIILCDPTVRFHVECLCVDCRQRGLISATKSPGNALPDAVANFERGVDLLYFANALIVDENSQELLEFTKLTQEAFNTTMMSACCGTLLCGTHPIYEGTTISVNSDSCRVTTSSSLPLQAAAFTCDIPTEQAQAITHHSTVPVIFNLYEEMESQTVQALLSSVTEPISASVSAAAMTNFEALCGAKSISIDNACFNESRASKP